MKKRGGKAKAKANNTSASSLAVQRKALLEAEGRKFVRVAAKFIFQGVDNMSAEEIAGITARCDVHGGEECPSLPKLPKKFKGLLGSIAGLNCYEWSSMGKTMRWLGESAFPFFVWLRERMMGNDDFAIAECVRGFDDDLLKDLVESKFMLFTLEFSPTLFGDVTQRMRKYMILLGKGRLRWHASIGKCGHQAAFERIFGRRVVMESIPQRFRAAEEEVKSFIEDMAIRRGFPPRRTGGRLRK